MIETSSAKDFYTAEAAYYLRGIAKARRYKKNEVTAHAVSTNAACRHEVESFIAAVFKQHYGAKVTQFLPELVALRDQQGVLMAAFGLRSAAKEPLFLEQYLDVSIEVLMTQRMRKNIAREEITCIGNLAVSNPRNAGVLISHIIQHSLDIGIEWAVATAHHSLQNGLIKGGRNVYPLYPADKARLPNTEQDDWGSYYDKRPQVIAIQGIAQY